MKKYLKITLLVIIAIILVGTFVFLYQKSKPKVIGLPLPVADFLK